MNHTLTLDFIEIAKEVKADSKSEEQWALVESDDMFQNGAYVGGFAGTELAFCFSVYEAGKECWFQLSLDEMKDVAEGRKSVVEISPAG